MGSPAAPAPHPQSCPHGGRPRPLPWRRAGRHAESSPALHCPGQSRSLGEEPGGVGRGLPAGAEPQLINAQCKPDCQAIRLDPGVLGRPTPPPIPRASAAGHPQSALLATPARGFPGLEVMATHSLQETPTGLDLLATSPASTLGDTFSLCLSNSAKTHKACLGKFLSSRLCRCTTIYHPAAQANTLGSSPPWEAVNKRTSLAHTSGMRTHARAASAQAHRVSGQDRGERVVMAELRSRRCPQWGQEAISPAPPGLTHSRHLALALIWGSCQAGQEENAPARGQPLADEGGSSATPATLCGSAHRARSTALWGVVHRKYQKQEQKGCRLSMVAGTPPKPLPQAARASLRAQLRARLIQGMQPQHQLSQPRISLSSVGLLLATALGPTPGGGAWPPTCTIPLQPHCICSQGAQILPPTPALLPAPLSPTFSRPTQAFQAFGPACKELPRKRGGLLPHTPFPRTRILAPTPSPARTPWAPPGAPPP
ncbi:PREDICTED: uncharacterized protein LOC103076126 [Lipotes vexillifer]|uniref:Uncharacterized protein LOC103076126 n=1 Tax=Lipotes vexillifer TaxID=118797 RepID=A0A340XZN5_LIPVE|nr:PREDICTED: uncharacterized protein LOC103076126 [Lipotes vexillifer]